MMLDELMGRLQGAAVGDLMPDEQLAADSLDTIQMLKEKGRVLEEKLAAEKARSERMADYISKTDTDEDICKKVSAAGMLGDCGLEGRDCRECILDFFQSQT